MRVQPEQFCYLAPCNRFPHCYNVYYILIIFSNHTPCGCHILCPREHAHLMDIREREKQLTFAQSPRVTFDRNLSYQHNWKCVDIRSSLERGYVNVSFLTKVIKDQAREGVKNSVFCPGLFSIVCLLQHVIYTGIGWRNLKKSDV